MNLQMPGPLPPTLFRDSDAGELLRNPFQRTFESRSVMIVVLLSFLDRLSSRFPCCQTQSTARLTHPRVPRSAWMALFLMGRRLARLLDNAPLVRRPHQQFLAKKPSQSTFVLSCATW